MSVSPVSVSTSTTQMCVPAGHVKFGGSKTAVPSSMGSTPAGRSCACQAEVASLGDRPGLVGRAAHPERAVGPLEVVLGDLELVGRDLPRLLACTFSTALAQRLAADRDGPRAVGVHPDRATARCRRAAPRRRRASRRARRPRSAPTRSRDPGRAARCRCVTTTLPNGRHSISAPSQPPADVAQRAEDVRRRQARTSRCSVDTPMPSCLVSPASRRAACSARSVS